MNAADVGAFAIAALVGILGYVIGLWLGTIL